VEKITTPNREPVEEMGKTPSMNGTTFEGPQGQKICKRKNGLKRGNEGPGKREGWGREEHHGRQPTYEVILEKRQYEKTRRPKGEKGHQNGKTREEDSTAEVLRIREDQQGRLLAGIGHSARSRKKTVSKS